MNNGKWRSEHQPWVQSEECLTCDTTSKIHVQVQYYLAHMKSTCVYVCVCVCSHTRHLLAVKFHFSHNLEPGWRTLGIPTRYGLESPGIESRWGEIFHTYPDRLRGPPSLLYNGYRTFPGDKGGRGVMLTTHPLLVPRLRKSWDIPPLTLWVLLGLRRSSLYPPLVIT
jgi:hypothetical protein